MKTNYRFIFAILILLSAFITSCSDDDDPSEGPDGGNEQPIDNGMYYPPINGDRTWEVAPAETLGWDTTSLAEAIRFAREKRSYNLLIIHKGKIVVEEYWRETTATSQHELNSVAKSFMGFVIGILQQDGTINLDDHVTRYMGEGWSASPNTEADITVRHLLTMTSGLNENLEYAGKPGEVWYYSHSAYKVLYEVIAAATGRSYREVFNTLLFKKLGMTEYTWNGRDVLSSARDAARFGILIMNDGVWNGEKLLKDEGYFNEMLNTSQSLQEAYGYLWWINGTQSWYDDDTRTVHTGSIAASMPDDARLAKGKHDQRIYVVPSLDMIVVRQGMISGLPESGEGSFDYELWARIMKAVRPATTQEAEEAE